MNSLLWRKFRNKPVRGSLAGLQAYARNMPRQLQGQGKGTTQLFVIAPIPAKWGQRNLGRFFDFPIDIIVVPALVEMLNDGKRLLKARIVGAHG